jgi:hypothetical protein
VVGRPYPVSMPTLTERFWLKANRTDAGCWLWTGAIGGKGDYGRIEDGGRYIRAHRLSWAIHNGPVPPGLFVCHTCDTPRCVNPAHLFLGTNADNMRDAYAKGHLDLEKTRASRTRISKFTAETRQLAIDMRNAGRSLGDCARATGMNSGHIWHLTEGARRKRTATA